MVEKKMGNFYANKIAMRSHSSPTVAKKVEAQKFDNSCKICRINIVAEHYQPDMVTNNLTKFEQNLYSRL